MAGFLGNLVTGAARGLSAYSQGRYAAAAASRAAQQEEDERQRRIQAAALQLAIFKQNQEAQTRAMQRQAAADERGAGERTAITSYLESSGNQDLVGMPGPSATTIAAARASRAASRQSETTRLSESRHQRLVSDAEAHAIAWVSKQAEAANGPVQVTPEEVEVKVLVPYYPGLTRQERKEIAARAVVSYHTPRSDPMAELRATILRNIQRQGLAPADTTP